MYNVYLDVLPEFLTGGVAFFWMFFLVDHVFLFLIGTVFMVEMLKRCPQHKEDHKKYQEMLVLNIASCRAYW